MADNPLITNDVPYSINTFTGDGTTFTREINFSGGYIKKEHVVAFQTSPEGADEDVTLTWIGDFTVQVSPVTPTDYVLTIFRDTPKAEPEVDFADGAIINEANLDTLAQQAVFVSAEMVDRFVITDATAQEALVNSEAAIAIAEATVGGDFTKFARTDVANTFLQFNTFNVSPTVPTPADADSTTKVATSAFVQGRKVEAIAASATDATTKANAAQSAAIAAAATDATNKSNAAKADAISAAATDATNKANAERDRAKSMEGFLFCMAFR